MIMLGTDVCSYLIRGVRPHDRRAVGRIVALEDACVSAVTRGGLRFGSARHAAGSRIVAAVDLFLSEVATLAWDGAAADRYGKVRADLER